MNETATGWLDRSVLRDVTWWSWAIIIALLATKFVMGSVTPVWAAIALCMGLMCVDLVLRRGDLRAISVQIRLGYALLLVIGLVPGVEWMHVVQLVGVSARNLTGYCLLERELLLFPWNRTHPLTLASAWTVLTRRPGYGGIINFSRGDSECVSACQIVGPQTT